MARLAGKYAIAEDLSPSYINQTSGYLPFNIRRLGLDSPATFTVEIIPLGTTFDSIAGPISFTGMSLLEDRVDSFYYALDTTMVAGQDFSFVLTLNNGLYISRDTITKTLGQLTSYFFDAADNTGNWTTSQWETSSSVYYTPGASITDSEFGNYSNNASMSITLNNPVDLTLAMKANLTFWARWELEPGYDYTQVEASIDGGSTWTPLCGKYTKPGSGYQDPGNPVYDGFQSNWVFEEVDLSDYVGESVLIRFTLQSDIWVTADGYYFDELNINAIFNNLQLNVSFVDGTCGNNDGVAVATITGGMLPYTIQWDDSFNSTTDSITGLAVGTYRVTITDNLGLSFVDSVEIINPGAPTVTLSTTDVSCYGGSDGDINATANGGVPPYTYFWTPPVPGPGFPAGTYNLFLIDGNGCAVAATATVSQPPEIVSTAIITGDSDSTGTGAIDLTSSGGTGTLTFAWSTSETTEDITGLLPGNYGVVITDSTGCSISQTHTVGNVVGIAEFSAGLGMIIFPNPSSGNFTLEFEIQQGLIVLQVTDLLGRVILHEEVYKAKSHIISLGDRPAGVYFLKLSDSDGSTTTRKLVIY